MLLFPYITQEFQIHNFGSQTYTKWKCILSADVSNYVNGYSSFVEDSNGQYSNVLTNEYLPNDSFDPEGSDNSDYEKLLYTLQSASITDRLKEKFMSVIFGFLKDYMHIIFIVK